MLDALNRVKFLRYGRVLERSAGTVSLSLFIPRSCRCRSILPVVINYMLLTLWIPVFLLGVGCYFAHFPALDGGSFFLGNLAGVLIGSALHETGHAASALCYRGRFYEGGVFLEKGMLGAYALIDVAPIKSRLHRIQVLAAGAEMNILLSGVGLIFCTYIPPASAFFFGFAIINLLLGLLNLTLSEKLDGMAVMGHMLGTDSFLIRAKHMLATKEERLRLLNAGPHGVVEFLICGILVALQGIRVSLYLLCVLELIECFL